MTWRAVDARDPTFCVHSRRLTVKQFVKSSAAFKLKSFEFQGRPRLDMAKKSNCQAIYTKPTSRGHVRKTIFKFLLRVWDPRRRAFQLIQQDTSYHGDDCTMVVAVRVEPNQLYLEISPSESSVGRSRSCISEKSLVLVYIICEQSLTKGASTSHLIQYP